MKGHRLPHLHLPICKHFGSQCLLRRSRAERERERERERGSITIINHSIQFNSIQSSLLIHCTTWSSSGGGRVLGRYLACDCLTILQTDPDQPHNKSITDRKLSTITAILKYSPPPAQISSKLQPGVENKQVKCFNRQRHQLPLCSLVSLPAGNLWALIGGFPSKVLWFSRSARRWLKLTEC